MQDLTATVQRMARREAAAFLLRSEELPALSVRVISCPECGAGTELITDHLRTLLPVWAGLHEAPVVPANVPSAGNRPTVTLLGCEALPARSFLLIAVALNGLGGAVVDFRTRAAFVAERESTDAAALIRELDEAEKWVDGLIDKRSLDDRYAGVPLPLAVSTRLAATSAPDRRTYRTRLAQHFLTPHPVAASLDRLNDAYQRARTEHAIALLDREAQLGY